MLSVVLGDANYANYHTARNGHMARKSKQPPGAESLSPTTVKTYILPTTREPGRGPQASDEIAAPTDTLIAAW